MTETNPKTFDLSAALSGRSFPEDVKDQLEDFGNYYFWYDGRLYESSNTDSFGFVDMETCELVTPRFGSFEESADYPFFDGRSMREAFDDIEFLAE